MKDMFEMVGISKQALHKHGRRLEYIHQVSREVIDKCQQIRADHKRMSCRKMYHKVRNDIPVGRDIFEQIGFANGYKLHLLRSKKRTTWATKMEVYPNLLEGKEL